MRSAEQHLDSIEHDEADTKIVFHVCKLNFNANSTIGCSDTDIIIVLLGNMTTIESDLKIRILLETGNS